MSNNPRIVVFKLKELIYTGIFAVLAILLIILLVFMFKSGKKDEPSASAGEVKAHAEKPVNTNISENPENTENTENTDNTEKVSSENKPSDKESQTTYNPGVYTSSLTLNNNSLEIEVCVDTNHINSVSIKNMDEAVTTMYPLIKNSMNDLSNQIVNNQSLENITYTDDCKYTYMILLDAISTTLDKAKTTAGS